MGGKLLRLTDLLLILVVVGCTTEGTPATVPSSLPAATTTVATTVTTPPPTTTTTAATTTTIDRVAEIEAIFQDLEERRLQALYEGDEETFKTLFANEQYMERSLGAFDVMEFDQQPDVRIVGLELVHESVACLAVRYQVERLDLGDRSVSTIVVVELINDVWGYSYSGEGWACEGTHPFLP